ncbi:MAG TPA: hypothetical protein PKY56_03620, partial [Candidatus Kapabacteria bacterium]|nr:hypothetical protein [Candidatus Kapabacteria bacterium]
MKKYIFFLLLLLSGSIVTAKDYWWQPLHCYSYPVNYFSTAANSTSYFVSNVTHGMYRSTNEGKTWDKLDNISRVANIKVCSFNLFAITTYRNVYNVLRSSDNGNTWIDITNRLPSKDAFDFKVIGSKMYNISTDNRLYCSTNFGDSWKVVSTKISDDYISFFDINGSNIFALINKLNENETRSEKILRSTNNGISWSEVNIGIPIHSIDVLSIINSYIYVSFSVHNNGFNYSSKLYKSTNNGVSWNKVNIGDDSTRVVYLNVLDGNILATTLNSVFISTNDGLTWKSTESFPWSDSYNRVGKTIFAGLSYSTNEGKSWTDIHSGLTNTVITCLAKSGSSIIAGTNRRSIFISDDNGMHWRNVYNEEGEENPQNWYIPFYSIATNGDDIYAGSMYFILHSSDKGKTWTKKIPDDFYTTYSCVGVYGNTIYTGSNDFYMGLYYSTDKGENWLKSEQNLGEINCINTCDTNIYIATRSFVYRSTDYGNNWVAKKVSDIYPNFISLSSSGNKIVAGTYAQGVFLSENNGESWVEIGSTIDENLSVYSSAIIDSNIFINTNHGVFLSRDNGNTWTDINAGLVSKYFISSLLINGDYIYAGDSRDGVYIAKLSDFGITSSNPNPPNS